MTSASIAQGASRTHTAAGAAAHVKYLHHFRALAILQIVLLHAGHAFLLRGFESPLPESNPVFAAVDVLLRNATIYFSMISGIIYARIFCSRPYAPFMKARLVNTGVPYVTITAIFTTLLWLRSSAGEAGNTIELARLIAYNAAMGEAWNTLWYIPVILILYAVSPLLFHIVSTPRWRWLMALLIVLPLAVSRTGTELTPAITIYFMGAYMFGLWLGRDLDVRLDLMERSASWIALVAGVSTAALSILYLADLGAEGPVSIRESLFYIQRLSLGVLILVALRLWSAKPRAVSDAVLGATATASFGLYFLHGPLVRPVVGFVSPLVPEGQPVLGLIAGIGATFAGGLLLSWAVILLARMILGRRSRLVIGA